MNNNHDSYFVHEDDWGMITIIPTQQKRELTASLENGGSQHVAPAITRIVTLTIADLAAAFGEALHYTDSLESGRTTAMEPVSNGFAFYHDLIGAVYGIQRDGHIDQMYFDNRLCDCDHDFTGLVDGLHQIGTAHDLILVDSWLDLHVPLSDRQRIEHYLEEE